MTTRNLDRLFSPRCVALVGASARPGRLGSVAWNNLRAAGFQGDLWPVNPKYDAIDGVPCFADPRHLPRAPDLAVLCTPAGTIPGLVATFGDLGTRAVAVITSLQGLGRKRASELTGSMLEAARPHTLRILGPDCVGLLVPGVGLNASTAPAGAIAGRLAFVSQSGAMAAAVVDWAGGRGIGFSHVVSIGDAADVDLGDLIDYLGGDAATGAILIHMESVTSPRKFMSAARAAARNKPVIVIRSGGGAQSASRDPGRVADVPTGSDDVYDAAIRRAGMLRVHSTEDLFGAVSMLASARPLGGDRLAVVANGGGPASVAVDELAAAGLAPAALSADTIAALERVLPRGWSRVDPVEIGADSDAQRYAQVVDTMLRDPGADALLVIHAPTPLASSQGVAKSLLDAREGSQRNLLACFMGGKSVAQAREALAEAGVPHYETPEQAVRAFAQLVQYRRNQRLLMEVPALLARARDTACRDASAIVHAALDEGRSALSEPEAMEVLRACGIPVVETRVVADEAQALAAATQIGFPVAVKVLSEQIEHKSDVGGVVLDLEDGDSVLAACEAIRRRAAALAPGARLEGFTVQAMARRPQAHELAVGATIDPVFGPIVLCGQAGIPLHESDGRAVALPPLNQVLARDLVSRSRVSRRLQGYPGRPAADRDAIHQVLVALGQMLAEIPQIVSLEIDPLLADGEGVLALDATIRLGAQESTGVGRFAILPYPQHLEQTVPWRDEQVVLRPIRPEDAPAHLEFFRALDPADVRARAMASVRELRPEDVARLTQIDYDREMALIATRRLADGSWETLGVARSHALPDRASAEFAVIVRSDMKGKGLGGILMAKLIAHCRATGVGELRGETLPDNAKMLKMARALGFRLEPDLEGGIVRLVLPLHRG